MGSDKGGTNSGSLLSLEYYNHDWDSNGGPADWMVLTNSGSLLSLEYNHVWDSNDGPADWMVLTSLDCFTCK